MDDSVITWLLAHHVCKEAVCWARGYATAQEAWESCDRVHWMLWLCDKISPEHAERARIMAHLAVGMAARAVAHVPEVSHVATKATETARHVLTAEAGHEDKNMNAVKAAASEAFELSQTIVSYTERDPRKLRPGWGPEQAARWAQADAMLAAGYAAETAAYALRTRWEETWKIGWAYLADKKRGLTLYYAEEALMHAAESRGENTVEAVKQHQAAQASILRTIVPRCPLEARL